ncbi:MAG: alpha/beta hydrolase [Bacteroidota bacterium]
MLYYKEYLLETSGGASMADWVVFIHGAGGSSSIWFKQLREFRQHFNVLLIDLRGHGKSKDLLTAYVENSYTFKDISLDVLEVLDHLRIQAAHFVGISLGCIIIRTLGELQPTRIQSMVLGGAITRLNIRSNVLMNLGNLLKRVVPYMWLYSLFAWVIMPKQRHEKSRSLFIEEAKRLAQKEFLRWYKMTAEINPLLKYFKEKELSIPTLYVMGDEDYMFLPPVKIIVSKHQSAYLAILSNSGHVVNVDQPDQFNHISIDFIRQHGGH